MKTQSTPTLKPARIGSISHGTLRTEDLLHTFLCELEGLCLLSGDYLSQNHAERDRYANLIGEAQDCFAEDGEEIDEEKEETANYLVNESMPDALNQFAPPYCYFGAHEGDGSDFGFWPSHDSIEELPRVNDSDEARALGEDCAFVNDHGNVTVYSGTGEVILEIV